MREYTPARRGERRDNEYPYKPSRVYRSQPITNPQPAPPPRLAKGTRILPANPEPSLGRDWFWSLQMEFLGRNLATAGGLALAYRLGATNK